MRGLAKPSWRRCQSLPNPLHSNLRRPDNKIIRQSQNNEPLRAQPNIPHPIMRYLLRLAMGGSITLHNQPLMDANEINDIAPNRHLPPKLDAETVIAERGPEQRLGVGRSLPLFVGDGDSVDVSFAVRHQPTILPLLPLREKVSSRQG